jgi:hypothetical protein
MNKILLTILFQLLFYSYAYSNIEVFKLKSSLAKKEFSENYFATQNLNEGKIRIFKYEGTEKDSSLVMEFADNLPNDLYYLKYKGERIPLISSSAQNQLRDIIVIVPYYTYSAYNGTGGISLYGPSRIKKRVVKIYRPLGKVEYHASPSYNPIDFIQKEFPNKISIINQVDLHKYDITKSKLIIIYGHDEYWPVSLYEQIKSAVNQGVNLLNLSGNTNWWELETTEEGYMFRTKKRNDYNYQLELLGVNFKNLGYPISNYEFIDLQSIKNQTGLIVKDIKFLDGFKMIDSSHAVFSNVNIKEGIWFGHEIQITDGEIDGWEINSNGVPKLINNYSPRILAETVAYRGGINRGAVMVEHKVGEGLVLSFASIGWIKGLILNDNNITLITKNAINYLIK